MPSNQLVIDIEDGIVSLFATEPELEVILVDWDHEVDPRSVNLVDVPGRGHGASALVIDLPVQPLSDLAGSRTETAIVLAIERGALLEPAYV